MAPVAMLQSRANPPQAFLSSYAPRLRSYGNALLAPIIPQTSSLPMPRTTKRGTTAINYAEDGYDDDDFDSEGPRRPTGLRSLRREDTQAEAEKASERGREIFAPVDVQPIWREYMGKARRTMTEKQVQTQAHLPLVLIPIKIDIDIQPWRPEAPLPLPHNAREMGIDETHPAYKTPEVTPAFRLKDAFLWNLHEALTTPDVFAKTLVDELDLPADRKVALIMQISQQIRSQLEEYSQAALHPLFNPTTTPQPAKPTNPQVASLSQPAAATSTPRDRSHASTPAPSTSMAATPLPNGTADGDAADSKADASLEQQAAAADVSATAVAVPSENDVHNPDDTYRCIIELRINLMNKLYSDKFEWSLLHPPGFAESFARQTCADLGLNAEWVSAMAHAIYEAVYRLRKESLENGLPGAWDLDTDAAEGVEAGWRYEPERLAQDWAPIIETLSKEEIENREKERERNMRRMRRETNRYVAPAASQPSNYFADPTADDTPMGRGERSKKKRRFRSLSPLGRDTPDTAGAYGGGTSLTEAERQFWRCEHCRVWGSAVWAVREGPNGPRTLCNNCGLLYERNGKLPPWNKDLFASERPVGSTR
ncbi:uncharacterized protein PV09_02325 [Verruconis gallopava]|uniref:GATA-type domain-containing protein n=1 Tax=Verruconis gallopava TaxID=253628 RepID=A0A0D1XV10_9PEZI|nr:uncharacterized protein PV09_02325 [Verruconis gallopava]KIW06611.1 hypothetical protein PV09_02325 [Verruconis gallopava]